jgi:hypothetical protein
MVVSSGQDVALRRQPNRGLSSAFDDAAIAHVHRRMAVGGGFGVMRNHAAFAPRIAPPTNRRASRVRSALPAEVYRRRRPVRRGRPSSRDFDGRDRDATSRAFGPT